MNTQLQLHKPVQKRSFLDKIKPNPKNAGYYFIAPIMVLFCVFMVYPIIRSFILSFQKFDAGHYKFVGFDNYILLFKDDIFLQALKNNFWYLIIQVPIMILLALILAVMINSQFLKYKGFFRMAFFMPAVTALVAYALVFRLLLNTDFGFINFILSKFGLPRVDWLNGEFTSKLSIIIAMTWRWTGYNMIILLAGLQGISEEIYEACDIDGANAVQRFFKVTLPLMKPIILFCAITSTIGTLQLFDESFILTKGGPDNATISVAHYLYNTGFRFMKFGYAAAMSYVLVIIIAVLSLIQFKFAGGDE
ncbi:carbohydrate ABC transporter permease [Thermobrachium celere]|uniref:Sugar ABC transporter permease n=1 Tax=Thermobrachium celere DSM 8682 TaxID=941824 RepID=R7RRI1_9CLOT|nr:sugar ABC transporter permease [Thermobrachium celere]CDF58807.1 Sugar ABC transporter permease [Thermobrachium celere DSM 8682]